MSEPRELSERLHQWIKDIAKGTVGVSVDTYLFVDEVESFENEVKLLNSNLDFQNELYNAALKKGKKAEDALAEVYKILHQWLDEPAPSNLIYNYEVVNFLKRIEAVLPQSLSKQES